VPLLRHEAKPWQGVKGGVFAPARIFGLRTATLGLDERRPPIKNQVTEMLLVSEGIGVNAVVVGNEGDHREHVAADVRIHWPHIGEVEPTALFGISPCEQKIDYAFALPGTPSGDLKQSIDCLLLVGGDFGLLGHGLSLLAVLRLSDDCSPNIRHLAHRVNLQTIRVWCGRVNILSPEVAAVVGKKMVCNGLGLASSVYVSVIVVAQLLCWKLWRCADCRSPQVHRTTANTALAAQQGRRCRPSYSSPP
jgi:hypothetical protein